MISDAYDTYTAGALRMPAMGTSTLIDIDIDIDIDIPAASYSALAGNSNRDCDAL